MNEQIKLRKGDEVQEIKSMEITIVVMTKGDFAWLLNGHKIYSYSYFNDQHNEQLFSNDSKRLNVIYRLHRQAECPAKIRKPHRGIYGQPIVDDWDKAIL